MGVEKMASDRQKGALLGVGGPAIPTVSILQSRREIEDLEVTASETGSEKQPTASLTNRQITSGMIIDWKEFEGNPRVKSQLLLKDGDSDENVIFSYIVEEWREKDPVKVCYRWVRKAHKAAGHGLVEEEHIYRGQMENMRKHGQGQYLIVRKFSDNTEKQQIIKGVWSQDILAEGRVVDENGTEKEVKKNLISLRSKRAMNSDRKSKGEDVSLEKVPVTLGVKDKGSGGSLSSIMDKVPSKKQLPPLQR